MDADASGLDRLDDPDAGVLRSVPSLWIPDNLKAAIKKACRYEPEATSTYQDCASHYGAAILPARPYHAKDKAAVEMSVLVVQRWILAINLPIDSRGPPSAPTSCRCGSPRPPTC